VSGSARRQRVTLPVAAWIVILVLTGGFQIYRDAPIDGAVFLAMAAALVIDLTGILPPFRSREWRPSRIILVGVLAAAAAVLALTPRRGIANGAVLIVSGILVLLIAWPAHETEEHPWTPRMRRTATLWAIVGIAVCLWELTMYLLGTYVDRYAFPALSDLTDPLLNHTVGRILFAVAWLLGGVALARRGRERERQR
jgi:hypothetical protein